MKMRDVAADSQVCCERNLRPISGAEQRQAFMLRFHRNQRASNSFAQTKAISRTVSRCFIQKPASFFGPAKRAFAERCIYVF